MSRERRLNATWRAENENDLGFPDSGRPACELRGRGILERPVLMVPNQRSQKKTLEIHKISSTWPRNMCTRWERAHVVMTMNSLNS